MPTPTGNLATNADPMIGEILGGRYLVERLIDRGGMGLVYLATEVARERHVVIKMLAQHWTEDADAVARFDREGERLAQLNHPNIVEMYDVGRAGEQAFIAMEYIDGEPLRRYLKRNQRVGLREFGPIAAQVLSAVGYAHAHEIMLRDIKPSNIMLCEQDGKASFVKLLDFGLAKLVSGDDVEITKAHVVGTAGYLSPEQIKGEDIDVRVDVYALGVLFFVMLTGKSPIFGDNDAAVLYNHVHGTPRQLADELPADHDIPEGLIELVHRCLAKDPSARPADASSIAEALFDCLPPEVLALPDATEETRAAIRTYRAAKLGVVSDTDEPMGEGPTSAEWTRPVLRKPFSGDAPAVVRAGTWKNVTEAARVATSGTSPAVSSRSGKPGTQTRVGLPAVAAAEHVESTGSRRPPPAKIDPRRRIRRTGPRKIVRSTGPRPAVGRGEARRAPLGSTEGPNTTRPEGSGFVGERDRGVAAGASAPSPVHAPPQPMRRPPPPAPPPAPLGVGSAPAAAPPFVHPVLAAPSAAIELEGQRRFPVALLIVAFVVLAMGGALAYGLLVHPSTSERADEASGAAAVEDPATTPEEGASSEPVDRADSPPPDALAYVEITAPAGAAIQVDGEPHGSVPSRLELPVGRHRLELTAPDHEPWRTEIEVSAGENPAISAELVALEPAPASVRRGSKAPPRDGRPATSPAVAPVPPPSEPSDSRPPKPPPSAPKKIDTRNDDDLMPSSKDDDDVFLPVGKKK